MDALNLGCGTDIRPDFVNLDVAVLPGVDVVHDLAAEGPLPFEDARFGLVVAKDILEHLDYPRVLRELHRILRPGGRLEITAPHFTSRALALDPTHRAGFSIDTLRFFVADDIYQPRSYYFDFHFARVERSRIVFHRYGGQPWNYVLEVLVNGSHRVQAYYEETGLSRLFPASNIEVTLIR
jgi:SAM-dependent methyltransferase